MDPYRPSSTSHAAFAHQGDQSRAPAPPMASQQLHSSNFYGSQPAAQPRPPPQFHRGHPADSAMQPSLWPGSALGPSAHGHHLGHPAYEHSGYSQQRPEAWPPRAQNFASMAMSFDQLTHRSPSYATHPAGLPNTVPSSGMAYSQFGPSPVPQ